jgi:hypothetical protein
MMPLDDAWRAGSALSVAYLEGCCSAELVQVRRGWAWVWALLLGLGPGPARTALPRLVLAVLTVLPG